MNYAIPIVILFAARFFTAAVFAPPLDGDLAWQRWLGAWIVVHGAIPRTLGSETFTAPGAAWTPQEWAFGLAAYAGSSGVAKIVFELFPVACAVGALIAVAYRCEKRGCTPVASACAVMLCGLALDESFGVRAQVVGWFCFAIYLVALEARPPKLIAALAIAAVWSNLHGSAMLACAIAGIFVVATLLEERAFTVPVRNAAIFAALTPLAISLNPFGIGLPLYAIELFRSPIRPLIQEWRPSTVHEMSLLYGDLPMLLIVGAIGIRGKRIWLDRLLVATFTALVFTAARHMAIFGIVLAPIFARALSDVLEPILGAAPAAQARRWMGLVLGAAALVLAAGVSAARVSELRAAKDKMPYAEMARLAAEPGAHNVFCADFAWCSHVLRYSNERSFLDGRADPFPPRVWTAYSDIAFVRPGWRDQLHETGTNAVIATSGSALDQALARAAEWKRVSSNADFSLYELRPGVSLRAVARPEGVEQGA
jgi:hypothetical protein